MKKKWGNQVKLVLNGTQLFVFFSMLFYNFYSCYQIHLFHINFNNFFSYFRCYIESVLFCQFLHLLSRSPNVQVFFTIFLSYGRKLNVCVCVCIKERERERGVDGSVKDTRVAGNAMVCERVSARMKMRKTTTHALAHTRFLSLFHLSHTHSEHTRTKLTLDFFVYALFLQ